VSAIFAEGLTRVFAPDIRAVDGINLNIPEGKIFGFLGANGSGKTTTVRMLTTLLRPTAGKASVQDLDVVHHADRVRASIGVALQDASLDEIQTGRELLTLQARLYGVRSSQVKARVQELLEIVDLVEAADRAVKGYSGGMRRRLDLAASLAHRPKIVFLDEPTTGLDPISRDAIWRHIGDLNRNEGVTFFLTTQYLEEADRMADEVAIMDRGRIVAHGSPEELKASVGADVVTVHVENDSPEMLDRAVAAVQGIAGLEDVRQVDGTVVIFVREGKTAVAPIVRALDEATIPVQEMALKRPTLDDVFLRMTGRDLPIEDVPGGGIP
jgi:ABC-2 type transport system ATP-binding protein